MKPIAAVVWLKAITIFHLSDTEFESHLVLGCFVVSVFSCVSRGFEMHQPSVQAVCHTRASFQKVTLNLNTKYGLIRQG
jgi:hypothetical protein